MTETTRLELNVPISEDDLLAFLLSRYPEDHLARLGIGPANCIIRDVQIEHDTKAGTPKCNFRICALTVVNADEVLSHSERAQKKVINLLEEREKVLKAEQLAKDSMEDSPSGPKLPTGGCVKQQIAAGQEAMRVKKQKKSSNS